jgi:hypothetical protein
MYMIRDKFLSPNFQKFFHIKLSIEVVIVY